MNGEIVYIDDVATAFADVVVRDQPQTFALSGGNTARRCYETLATRSGIDWPSVEILFSDERMVPVDHPDSNEGVARAELLDHVPVKAIHSMANSDAETYDALVRSLGSIDLVHLGMGADGHTASLFPGTPALDITDRYVVTNSDELHPHPRLTFTYPGIALGRHVVLTVEGEEKRDAWNRVLAGEDLPAGRVWAEQITWLVDEDLSP
ncbi:MAG: 6-phosphogluconolactonase [Acidimicrobiales bacterium]|jgi:6-phosphogluconolactonase|nr:6-phosphogluconolactonase [Acidimicrobiales bacterium]